MLVCQRIERLEPQRVDDLRRSAAVECLKQPALRPFELLPVLRVNEEHVVAWPLDPSESHLPPEGPGDVVILEVVHQRQPGTDLGVCRRAEQAGREVALRQLQHVALSLEEHTSELQSQSNLVCRLLLEKKNKNNKTKFNPKN